MKLGKLEIVKNRMEKCKMYIVEKCFIKRYGSFPSQK